MPGIVDEAVRHRTPQADRNDTMSNTNRYSLAYANFVVQHPLRVLAIIGVLFVGAAWGTSRLTINSNQLDLISQDLPEVKNVKRLIDMVGGSGYLMLTLRSDDETVMKKVADDLATKLLADKENVRFVTYKVPVEFAQEKMVLFVKTEDLLEAKGRIDKFLKEKARRANPFYIALRDSPEPTLEMEDLKAKYDHMGKKTILDDYYISHDRKMLLLLIKPMWDSNELGKTKIYIDKLNAELAAYSQQNAQHVSLKEDYNRDSGKAGGVAYGYTGSYKTNLDDSYAISNSLEPVTIFAFAGICLITVLFFRFKILPTVLVIVGMVVGTILTMGFTYFTVGQLNMITSILGGILMGFGVDYGIHFVFRTRIELGQGKPYDIAIRDALVNAGRPAFVAAIVTGGSFMVLLASQFRGFSQFGFLAGAGTVIIGLTMFSFSAAVLALIGKMRPALPERLIGKMTFAGMNPNDAQGDLRIPRPKLILAIATGVVAVVCAFAIPWSPDDKVSDNPGVLERLRNGVSFNYNTRALMPEDQYSVILQDEINDRFQISSDPVAIYTKDLAGAKEVYDELTKNAAKYNTFDQVVSIFSFVPPHDNAVANAKVLDQWREELNTRGLDPNALSGSMAGRMDLVQKILNAKPYGVEDVPEIYTKQFVNLPSALPENRGYLTFVYPSVDLMDGKMMMAFADQVGTITTENGHQYFGSGAAILYAKLARIVLFDGKLTVFLATLWILVMHYLDFRSVRLASASVIPLGVGLVMMLGLMSITHHNLNFMNIIMLPILLGFGVSHGLYLLHRFLEGTSPAVALRSVGAAVASSTLTAIAGFASLFLASHNGLKSMGYVACLGLTTTLVVSFTVLAAVLQLIHDGRIHEPAQDRADREARENGAQRVAGGR